MFKRTCEFYGRIIQRFHIRCGKSSQTSCLSDFQSEVLFDYRKGSRKAGLVEELWVSGPKQLVAMTSEERREEGVGAEKWLQLDALQLQFVKTLNQSITVKVQDSFHPQIYYSGIYYCSFLFSSITTLISSYSLLPNYGFCFVRDLLSLSFFLSFYVFFYNLDSIVNIQCIIIFSFFLFFIIFYILKTFITGKSGIWFQVPANWVPSFTLTGSFFGKGCP